MKLIYCLRVVWKVRELYLNRKWRGSANDLRSTKMELSFDVESEWPSRS